MAKIIQRFRRNPDILAVALLSLILGAGTQAFQAGLARSRAELPFRARVESFDAARPRWMIERVRTRFGRLPALEKPALRRLSPMEY